ncbi:hypothetical protein ES332_A08G140800v1 [Gossypium tomentosum]|nr:hypothetical protein ES332_A08G140800v1 [Gossypium tomentosum]
MSSSLLTIFFLLLPFFIFLLLLHPFCKFFMLFIFYISGDGVDCKIGGKSFGSISCSICLETVIDNEDRSWAKASMWTSISFGYLRRTLPRSRIMVYGSATKVVLVIITCTRNTVTLL